MAELATVRRTFVDGKYGQIHCRTATPTSSKERPIVCLHMSPKSSVSFRELLPHLAVDRTALAPDNPGHGESDLPPDNPHVTISDYAESLWDAIDALAPSPVHLVGYHTGSMVAVEAARQRPDDVASIINIAAPILTADELDELHKTYAPLPLDREGSRFTIMWERVIKHLGPDISLQFAATSFAENLRAVDDYEWGHRAAFNFGLRYNELLKELAHPFLLINPHDDCYELSKRATQYVKDLECIDYPEIEHGFISERPAPLAATILDFVRRHDSTS